MFLTLFINTLLIAGTFCTLLGILTVFHWFKSPKAPSDSSNRINNITSWWFGLTRPDILARSYTFFQQDMLDNVEDVEKVKNNSKSA